MLLKPPIDIKYAVGRKKVGGRGERETQKGRVREK